MPSWAPESWNDNSRTATSTFLARRSPSPARRVTLDRSTDVSANSAATNMFLRRWKGTDRKQAIIDELEAEGLRIEPLADEVNPNLDPFDLICHVAYGRPALTRRERASNVRKRDVFSKYGPQSRAVLTHS